MGSVSGQRARQHASQLPNSGWGAETKSPAASTRKHWYLVAGIILMIALLAAGIFVWVRHVSGPPSAQGPFPTVVTFAHDDIACPAAVAWSPDSTRIAVVGFSACPQNQLYPASGPVSTAALTIYDARTGKPVHTTDLGHAIGTQALPPTVRDNAAVASQAQVLFGTILWSPHTRQIALSITTFYADPNGSGQPNVYDVALILAQESGAPRVIATPGSTLSGASTNSVATSFLPLPVTRWDLSTGTAATISVPQALAYSWSANDTLSASLPLPASPGTTPAVVGIAPIGDPGGDLSYSVWQRGSVGFGVRCGSSSGGAGCCTDTTHLTATFGVPLAWSPDGRYVLVPQTETLVIGAVGQLTAPPVNAANIPGACASPAASSQYAALPVRDAGLASGLRAFDLTRVGLVVAWSPDGERIAVRADHSLGGSAHELSIFDCRSGKLLGSYSAQQVEHGLPAGRGSTTQFGIGLPPVWSPDGTRLLVLDNDLRVLSILGPDMFGH